MDCDNSFKLSNFIHLCEMIDIFLGLKDGPNPKVKLLVPFLDHIIMYITSLAMDDGKTDGLISSCLGLIG